MPRGKAAKSADGVKINKMNCVREALTALGKKAMPKAIVEFIQSQHQFTMSADMVSNYKSYLLSKGKHKKKGGLKAGSSPAALVAAGKNGKTGAITIDDIRAVKALADKIGADKIRQLAEVLAK
jgi:hypothetical protein